MTFGTVDRHALNQAVSGDRLDDGSTRESVGAESRDAALAFMSGVGAGWTKLDLALWLTALYARATRHAKHGERVAPLDSGEEISADRVEELLTHVRGQLLASLEKASFTMGTLDFADACVAHGFVRKVHDDEGRTTWIPVDASRMRLRDRVRSLFAADYLNAPYTYAELLVCNRCEAVVFDERLKRLGICGAHHVSGIVPCESEIADDGAEADPYARLISR